MYTNKEIQYPTQIPANSSSHYTYGWWLLMAFTSPAALNLPISKEGQRSEFPLCPAASMVRCLNEYGVLMERYWQGKTEYVALMERHSQGKTEYGALMKRYWQGKTEYEALMERYWQGKTEYGALMEWYSQGKTEYGALVEWYWQGETEYGALVVWYWQGKTEYEALVEWHSQGKTEALGENVPHCNYFPTNLTGTYLVSNPGVTKRLKHDGAIRILLCRAQEHLRNTGGRRWHANATPTRKSSTNKRWIQ
jgi:hypothetical protein